MIRPRIHKTVVLPDIHTPKHDERAVRAVLAYAKYLRPDRIILLGDVCDFDSISSYDLHHSDDFVYLEDEIGATNVMLDRIERAVPARCEKYYIGGNHEDRWHKVRAKRRFSLDRVSHSMTRMGKKWADEFSLDKRKWNWCEYGGTYEIDKIVYTHGWATAAQSAAKQEGMRFPGKNVIFGHTHRHQVWTSHDIQQMPVESETIGTLSRFDLSYMRGKPAIDWVHGFMVIYTRKDGSFTKVYRNIVGGRFIAHNQDWGDRRLK